MSDVSGIPYMGPMGTGNFFAPQFSYNPQINPTAGYAGPAAYSQGYLNDLFARTQASEQHTADLITSAATSMAAFTPNTFNMSNAGSGLTMSQLQQPWLTPEGGVNNVFSGGGSYQGPGFGGNVPTINWDSLFSGGGGGAYNYGSLFGSGGAAAPPSAYNYGSLFGSGSGGGGGGGSLGAGMLSSLGGLGGAPYTPQPGGSALDWGGLFSGFGGGGARADPLTAQQQQPVDFGSLFGRGVGGTYTGAASSPMTYDQMGQTYRDLATTSGAGAGWGNAPAAMPSSDRLLGYTPREWPSQQASVFDTGTTPVIGTQDTGPYGGGAGIGGLDTGRAIGEPYTRAAEPQRGMLQEPVTEAYNPYYGVTSPYGERTGGEVVSPGSGLTATDLSEQARARLAEIMSGAKEPGPDEIFAGDRPVPTEGQPAAAELPGEAGRGGMVGRPADPYDRLAEAVPLPRPRPAGAPAAESGLRSRQEALATLKKELQTSGLTMTSGYRDPTDPLSRANPRSAHSQGRAFDVRARTPEQADAAIEQIRGLLNPRGLVEGRDYRIIDEVRNPSPWATGPHVHTQFTEEGMQRYQREAYREPAQGPATTVYPGADAPRPPEDIPPASVLLPMARPAEAPARESQVNRGQDIPRPPEDIPDPRVSGPGFNALDAAANAPKGPSGVEKAQSFLNRSVESILQQHSPENLGKAGFVMDIKQPLREALKGPFGGAILSGLQPKLGSLGLTRSDFDKAVADPRARFGGGFGESGEFSGQLPSPGAFTPYPGWRQSSDFEYQEQLGRDQLARLQTGDYELPEVAPTPIGSMLGLEDLQRPTAAASEFGASRGAGTAAMQAAYPDIPAGIFTGNFQRPESNDFTGQGTPAGVVNGPYELPDLTPPAPGWSDWFGNLGKQIGNPFVSPAGGAEQPGGARGVPDSSEYGPGLGSPGWSPDTSQLGQFGGSNYQYPYVEETTNLPANLAAQRAMGDPFNPNNYNTLDQAYDLAVKRAPFVQELLSRPDLMQKAKAVSAAEIGPDLNRRTDTDIAGFFETMLNNMATGARATNFPTLESYLSNKGYYEPIRKNQPSMAAGYQALADDPALSARLDRIFQEVVRGSNVSNLSTQNSVQTSDFSQGGEGALLPQWGGVMGQFVPGPGEYFTSMLNPYNDPRATSHIGAGAQQKYRDFYRSLMPPGQMPWERR